MLCFGQQAIQLAYWPQIYTISSGRSNAPQCYRKYYALFSARNILLAEPLVEVSASVAYAAHSRRAMEALIADQHFAVGSDAGGAVGMVLRANAELRGAGDSVCVLATDISNAFG